MKPILIILFCRPNAPHSPELRTPGGLLVPPENLHRRRSSTKLTVSPVSVQVRLAASSNQRPSQYNFNPTYVTLQSWKIVPVGVLMPFFTKSEVYSKKLPKSHAHWTEKKRNKICLFNILLFAFQTESQKVRNVPWRWPLTIQSYEECIGAIGRGVVGMNPIISFEPTKPCSREHPPLSDNHNWIVNYRLIYWCTVGQGASAPSTTSHAQIQKDNSAGGVGRSEGCYDDVFLIAQENADLLSNNPTPPIVPSIQIFPHELWAVIWSLVLSSVKNTL